MFQIVYFSKACQPSTVQLAEILKSSRRNNERLGVTGILLYRDGFFIQILEGEKEIVLNLFENKIRKDRRHKYVVQLLAQSCEDRIFANQNMAFRAVENEGHRNESDSRSWNGLLKLQEPCTKEALSKLIDRFRGSVYQDHLF